MGGGGAAATDEIEQLVVALALIAGLDLLGDVARHGWCAEDAPQCLCAGDNGLSVLLGREIIGMDRWRLARISRLDPDITAALWSQQRADAGDARERMQFAADGVAGIERNRTLAVGRGGGRVRAHEAAGGDSRHGEEAAAADGVAQALRD